MKKIGLLTFLLLAVSFADAQSILDQYVKKVEAYQTGRLQEKIFVHLDRSFYAAGEKAWFKIYVTDGYIHQPLALSKVAYLEVLDEEKKPVVQIKVGLEDGTGNGSVRLPASLSSGNYIFRVYTNWMKNFSPEFYFQQPITIVNVFRSLEKNQKPEVSKLDIQFFPEGGQLVNGLTSKIACRVVNASGTGIPYMGFILSSKGDTLVRFAPLKFGIGHFYFTPFQAEQYKVVIKELNGITSAAILPPIQSSGYTLHVKDSSQNKLLVSVKAKGPEIRSPIVYLIGHTRQVIKVANTNHLNNGQVDILIAKEEFGEGISHITLFNAEFKPVAQRLIFIQPKKNSMTKLTTELPEYETRSKVKITIDPQTELKGSINLSLSISKLDSLQQFVPTNIHDYLYLTSDLKGNIEWPEFYFSNDPSVAEATDHLMLTHGWSRFQWDDVREETDIIKFLPEYRGHLITGKVVDRATEKTLSGITTYLASPQKKVELYESISDRDGNITFEVSDLIGPKKVFVQTLPADSVAQIKLLPPFSDQFSIRSLPPVDLSNKASKALIARSVAMQVRDVYNQPIQTTQTITDSSSFYGTAQEEYTLNDYTRFPLMEEVMREYVKGVRLRKNNDRFIFKVVNGTRNIVYDNEPLVLLDGVPVFDTDKLMTLDPLKVMQIDVVTGKYFLGAQFFDGIVSFKTYTGDLAGFPIDPKAFTLDYDALERRSEFFSPKYESPAQLESRLPDPRQLLCWVPDFTFANQREELTFYTSDQPGTYQVIIQGISEQGYPISESCIFTVKIPR
ncbi:MAG: hypothetical protein IPK96_06865 [Flammeovirgaceae bacterium]|nr:hypothetical protein [Flammeovirgaceae bacterium]